MTFGLAVITLFAFLPGVQFNVNGEPYQGPRWIPLARAWVYFALVGYLGGSTLVSTKEGNWMQNWMRFRRIARGQIVGLELHQARTPLWAWPGFPFWFGVFPLMMRDYSMGNVAKVAVVRDDGKRFFVGTRDPEALAASLGMPLGQPTADTLPS